VQYVKILERAALLKAGIRNLKEAKAADRCILGKMLMCVGRTNSNAYEFKDIQAAKSHH
jgi:hypothetical protein